MLCLILLILDAVIWCRVCPGRILLSGVWWHHTLVTWTRLWQQTLCLDSAVSQSGFFIMKVLFLPYIYLIINSYRNVLCTFQEYTLFQKYMLTIVKKNLRFFFSKRSLKIVCNNNKNNNLDNKWTKLLDVKLKENWISRIVFWLWRRPRSSWASLSVECRASILTLAGGRLQSPVSVQWSQENRELPGLTHHHNDLL